MSTALMPGLKVRRSRWPRLLGVLWLLIAATLPLQWYLLTDEAAGALRPFHVTSAAFLMVYFTIGGSLSSIIRSAGTARIFVVAVIYWMLFCSLALLYYGVAPAEMLQQFTYAAVGLVVMSHFSFLHANPSSAGALTWRLVRWSSTVGVASFLLLFLRSATTNGVDVVNIVATTVRRADPSFLEYRLFRPVFISANNPSASGNIRHEVFASLLALMWISIYARGIEPIRGGWRRRVFDISIALSATLVILSLSRSIIVALILGAVLWPLRNILTGRISFRTLQALCVLAPLAVLGVSNGLASVVVKRFTAEQSSYTDRVSALSASVNSHSWFGGDTTSVSAHNFILDAWLQGGVLASIAAIVVVGAIVYAWGRLANFAIRGSGSDGSSTTAMTAVAALGLLPIIRLFTAGGGVLHLTEWIGLGFFGAVYYHSRCVSEASTSSVPAALATRGGFPADLEQVDPLGAGTGR